MPQIFYFMLKVILCSGVLFGYYHLFLRNKVYHAYNRYYLLGAVVLSLLVPTIKFDVYNSDEQAQLQPIQLLQVVNNSDAYVEEVIITGHTKNIELSEVLTIAYVAVGFILLVSLLQLLFRIYSLIRNSKRNHLDDIVLINSTAEGTPFSFLRYLFWNNEIDINTETGRHIFSHELAHIKEKHSLDKIFLNITLVFCWINPFFWLIRKELNMIHEFIADKKAVGQYDTAVLASMIIKTAYPKHNFLITNHFFYSPIKRRLEMLAKYKTARTTYFTRILALPILFILIAAFTFKAKEAFTAVVDKEFVVVIDAGHGGKDDGARAVDGTYEKDLNLSLAKMVKELNRDEKIKIILTREADIYQTPKEKAEIANKLNADVFISIHTSSSPQKYYDVTSGMEVYVARDSFQNSGISKTLASSVIGTFSKNYQLKINPNPIQRPTGIWILQASKCPTVLIEAGYISNTRDRDYLKSKEGMETFAKNLLDAIHNYLAQPAAAARANMPASVANVLGLTSDQVNITRSNGDTLPKSAKDMLALKGDDETIIENVNMVLNLKKERTELEKSLIVINDKIYDIDLLKNKQITAKRAFIYGKNNKKMMKKYGNRAKDGAVIFEGGVIQNSPNGKYDDVIDRANQSEYTNASQRLNEKEINLNQNNKTLNTNTLRITGGTDSLNQPLYFLDGKQIVLPTLKALDPKLIKSIDVLKGEAALLKFGEDAKHGAILIATKQLADISIQEHKLIPSVKLTEPEITLSGITSNRISISRLKDIINVQTNVPGYKVISATMYFVGAGFPNVMTTSQNGESLADNNLIKRIKAGTTITFDNIIVEDVSGKRSVLKGKAFTFFDTENITPTQP